MTTPSALDQAIADVVSARARLRTLRRWLIVAVILSGVVVLTNAGLIVLYGGWQLGLLTLSGEALAGAVGYSVGVLQMGRARVP